MAQIATQPKFPSDAMLVLLTQLQLVNNKINKEQLQFRYQEVFRNQVKTVVLDAIRSMADAIDEIDKEKLFFLGLSNGKSFTVAFVIRLIWALTEITGKIPGDKDDEIIRLLYKELPAIVDEVSNEDVFFKLDDGEYMIRVRHSPSLTPTE